MGIFGISKKEKERINYLMNVGMKSIEKREYFEASRSFSEILKLDPKNQKALYYMGRSLAGEERHKEAIEYYDKAIQIKPDDDETWYRKGIALIDSGNYSEEALNSLNKAYELNQDNAWITYSICHFYNHNGDLDQAIASLDRYLSNHPDDAESWGRKGEILEKRENYDNALTSYSKALSLYDKGIIERDEYLEQTYGTAYIRVCNNILMKEDFNKVLPLGKSESIIDKCLCSILNEDHNCFDMWLDREFELCPPDADIGDQIVVLTTDHLYFIYDGSPSIENIEWEPVERFKVSWVERVKKYDGSNILYICMDNSIFAFRDAEESQHFISSLSKAVSNKRVKNKLQPPKNTNTIIDFSSIKEYLKNGDVVMQTFKCPGCGASLEFPDNVDTTTCQYCGNKIKAVDLFEKIRTLI